MFCLVVLVLVFFPCVQPYVRSRLTTSVHTRAGGGGGQRQVATLIFSTTATTMTIIIIRCPLSQTSCPWYFT
jgi:hypothetical protein